MVMREDTGEVMARKVESLSQIGKVVNSLVREWKAHEECAFQICIKLENVKLELEKAVKPRPRLSPSRFVYGMRMRVDLMLIVCCCARMKWR